MIAASVAHAPVLAALHAAAFPPAERWGEESFAAQLGLPGVFGRIDPRGGFVLARAVAGEAEILTVAVAPDARRQGVARAMMEAALTEAASFGARDAFLEVAETNGAARALYAALGFRAVGRRPRYYSSGVDALVLARSIDNTEKELA